MWWTTCDRSSGHLVWNVFSMMSRMGHPIHYTVNWPFRSAYSSLFVFLDRRRLYFAFSATLQTLSSFSRHACYDRKSEWNVNDSVHANKMVQLFSRQQIFLTCVLIGLLAGSMVPIWSSRETQISCRLSVEKYPRARPISYGGQWSWELAYSVQFTPMTASSDGLLLNRQFQL
jgi:hypothetical protein